MPLPYVRLNSDGTSSLSFTFKSTDTNNPFKDIADATGEISGSTVAITLGQSNGGTIDLGTNVDHLRFDSGINASSVPYRYSVDIYQKKGKKLQIDAVAASSGPISIKSEDDLTIVGNAIRSSDDISFSSSNALLIAGEINSSNGNVSLTAPSITLGSDVTACFRNIPWAIN